MQSDLATAYLERAVRTRRPLDYVSALAAADSALDRESGLSEAHFNRAIALEHLGLVSEAKAAWHRYLGLDPGSAWAAEARRHAGRPSVRLSAPGEWREALRSAAARPDPRTLRILARKGKQVTRRFFEEEVLADWADAYLEGRDEDARRVLHLARVGVEALKNSQDSLLSDAITAIATASSLGHKEELSCLARAHRAYRSGRRSFERGDYTGAARALSIAEHLFTGTASPFRLRAGFSLGSCDYYLARRDRALKRLTAVSVDARRRGYMALLGETLWMIGLTRVANRELSQALGAYSQALEAFEASGEVENIAGAHNVLAESLDYEGAYEAAWRHRYLALQRVGEIDNSHRLYQIYATAAIAARRMGNPRIALYFQSEAVRFAEQMQMPLARSHAHLWRAKYLQQIGSYAASAQDLAEARAVAELMPANEVRERTIADILLAQAEALRGRPERTVELVTAALDRYLAGGYQTHLIEAYVTRAGAMQALNRPDAAEQDLSAALGRLEAWRTKITTPEERTSFLHAAQDVFEAMISFQLEVRRDAVKGFELLEQRRARVLLDFMASEEGIGVARPFSLATILSELPRDAVLVSYAVVHSRLFVFAFDRSGLRLCQVLATDWAGVRAKVVAFRAGIEGHASQRELDLLGSALYRDLIAVPERVIPSAARIVLVTDGVLARLPFSALRNPRTKRYLIEDHAVVVCPSASVFVAARRRAERGPMNFPPRLLVVGDPRFDRTAHATLARLPAAAREAADLKRLLPSTRVLTGAEATRSAILAAAPGFDIVHFSTHAVDDIDTPAQSFLVLAPEPGRPGSGALFADDVLRRRPWSAKLVVLAACGTADARPMAGLDGANTLASSFLAAGVPHVIGSYWDAEDAATRLFMQQLYGRLSRGESPADALRATQVAFIRHRHRALRSPRIWAPFQATGSIPEEATS